MANRSAGAPGRPGNSLDPLAILPLTAASRAAPAGGGEASRPETSAGTVPDPGSILW
jgi:hypothetical protein